MMRQMKFRVWDILEGRYITSDKGYQGHYIIGLDGKFHNLQNGSGGDECVVQQYIGCKDKNGKDIYDGDILTFEEDLDCTGDIKNITLVCRYEEYNAWFGFYEPKEIPDDIYSGYYWMEIAGKCKVVGNIFENPRLLMGFKS